MLRTTWRIGNDDDPVELARRLDANLAEQISRGAHFKAWRSSEAMMRILISTRIGRMGETAVSYTPTAAFGKVRGESAVRSLQAWVSTVDVGPSLIAQVAVWRGRLVGGLVAGSADLDRAGLDALAETLEEILGTVAGKADA